MAWTAFNGYISFEILALYISAIFWTLGYDTIYGVQDIYDDEIIGLKSTSIKFKRNIKEFIAICLLIGSKQENVTESGDSSTIKSTPVAFSISLMFLPSLPISLPFISSFGIETD